MHQAGPTIITGGALGIRAVSRAGAPPLHDDHKVTFISNPTIFSSTYPTSRNGASRSSSYISPNVVLVLSFIGSNPKTPPVAQRRIISMLSSACSL